MQLTSVTASNKAKKMHSHLFVNHVVLTDRRMSLCIIIINTVPIFVEIIYNLGVFE